MEFPSDSSRFFKPLLDVWAILVSLSSGLVRPFITEVATPRASFYVGDAEGQA